jgi:DNA-binding transcriptional regulator YiaG
MTGTELKAIRKRAGLTQVQLADLVGLHWNSIARQERGEVRITEPVARLIRLVTNRDTARPQKRPRKGAGKGKR